MDYPFRLRLLPKQSSWLAIGLLVLAVSSAAAMTSSGDHSLTSAALIRADDGQLSSGDLRSQLGKICREQPADAFEVFETQHYAVSSPSGKALIRPLKEEQSRLLISAFGDVDKPDLRRFLASRGNSELREVTRLACLKILGAHGTDADAQALIQWAANYGSNKPISRALRDQFRRSLASIIERHPEVTRVIPRLFPEIAPALIPSFLTSLSESSTGGSLEALARCLDLIPEANSLVLSELAIAGSSRRVSAPEFAKAAVTRILEQGNPMTQSAAISACGALNCGLAVPELIRLLDNKNANLAQQSLHALREITLQSYPADSKRWTRWYENVTRWRAEEYPDLLHAAVFGIDVYSANALKEISKRRFYRESSAQDLAPCLERPELELVALTCSVLGHLKSKSSTEHLIPMLDSGNDLEVRKAAYGALRRITDQNHGDIASQWTIAGW